MPLPVRQFGRFIPDILFAHTLGQTSHHFNGTFFLIARHTVSIIRCFDKIVASFSCFSCRLQYAGSTASGAIKKLRDWLFGVLRSFSTGGSIIQVIVIAIIARNKGKDVGDEFCHFKSLFFALTACCNLA